MKITRFLLPFQRLLLLLLLAGPTAFAQAPAWQSAVELGTVNDANSYVQLLSTVADANGNLFIAGAFNGTVRLGNTTLVSAGQGDMFVAKWNTASAGFVWAQRAGGSDGEYLYAMTRQGASLYLIGTFRDAATFGTTLLAGSGNPGGNDLSTFITRVDDNGSTGSFAWALEVPGPYVRGTSIAVNGPSVYISGNISDAVPFGTTTLDSRSGGHSFAAKITDAGSSARFTWARNFGGATLSDGWQLALNGSSIYLTGRFFGTGIFGTTRLNSAGDADIYVARLDDTGPGAGFVWAIRAGGAAADMSRAISVVGTSIYLTGHIESAFPDFGARTLVNAQPGTPDVFVTKVTDNGTSGAFIWAERAGGTRYDQPVALAVRGSSLYLTGYYNSATATFGNTTLTNLNPMLTTEELFVAKMTDAGTSAAFNWARQAGGPYNDIANSVDIIGNTLYVCGNASLPATFGSLTLANPAAYSASFLATLTDPTLTATTSAQSMPGFTLAPNPARAATTITLPAIPGAAQATLTLTDALGRTLRTEAVVLPAAGLRHELSLAGLAPGLYALRLQAGATAATHLLVVE